MTSKLFKLRFLPHYLLLPIFIIFLSACSGSKSPLSTQNTSPNIQGNAVKGVISNAIIQAFDTSSDPRLLIAETRTDKQGNFSLPFLDLLNSQNKVILLALSTDALTSMTCDLISGCIENSSGKLIQFGEKLNLPANFKLLGLITHSKTSASYRAFISPLSHIIVSTAQKLPQGLTDNNIQIVSKWLTTSFELKSSPLDVETPDITNLLSLNTLTDQQLKQGILSAVFYEETLTSSWSQALTDLDSLSLENIFRDAASLSNDLAARLEQFNSPYIASLASISAQTSQQYQALISSQLVIQSQPSSITTNESTSITLHVQVSGSGPINYQWQKNDVDIQGANSSNYSLPNAQLSDAGTYSVIVSNASSTIKSLHALVIINKKNNPVTIIKQPLSNSIIAGDSVTLSVEVSGDGPTFQWQKDGSIIPGATKNSYTILSSAKSDEGSYRVTVSNSLNQISSNFVNIWVSTPIAPLSITQQPQSTTANENTSATFSVSVIGGGFISYQWRKNNVNINGAYSSSYSITSTTANDAADYDVVITNSQGSITSSKATLNFIPNFVPVSIIQQPQSKSITVGGQTSLIVRALGDGPLQYQWYLNGNAINNATTATHTISNAALKDEGIYSVKVNNIGSSETSLSAVLTVIALPSVLLNWTTPTLREDGSLMAQSEIAGYVIQHGPTSTDLSTTIHIGGGLTTSYTLTGVQSSTLFLRIATIDSTGQQGQFSSAISLAIR